MAKKSIDIDSTYAPAWSLLSSLYFTTSLVYVTMPMEDAMQLGKTAARKAIELDPKFVRGYMDLARWEHADWNFKEATRLIDKATQIDPYNYAITQAKANLAKNNGNLELAIEWTKKLIELDPLEKYNYYSLGFNYWMNGEFSKAEEMLNKYLLHDPNSGFANSMMGRIQLSIGQADKALEYMDKISNPFWNLYGKCMVVYAIGNKQEANKLLEKFVTDWGDKAWPNIAEVYAFRGEIDEAFKWLELAYDNNDSTVLEILNYPTMENLWGDPRWNKFIDKLGLPDDHGFHFD